MTHRSDPAARPAPPCVVAPSADANHSFLHLENLSRDDKKKWLEAAGAAGLPFPEWIERELNRAAAAELAANLAKKSPPA